MDNFAILFLMWIGCFLIGFGFGMHGKMHSMNEMNFQKCSEMYDAAEDILECLWILENN